ncbi:MAG: GTP cyclohydrolase II [Syntrophobacterales bacterium]|nr:GTP cyclohydrolase II [Syntrophobacterales bacterium]
MAMPSEEFAKVTRKASARIPTAEGEFQLHCYLSHRDHKEHLALVRGQVKGGENVLVRLHSECFTGDVLGSRRCDCNEQLHLAMQRIGEAGSGIVLYLRQEGRGIGLIDKLKAYNLQDAGYDTVEANLLLGHAEDEREYSAAALILQDLGVHSIRLLTNNLHKIESLTAWGIKVTDRLPLQTPAHAENCTYLATKARRMGHLLGLPQASAAPAASPGEHFTIMEEVRASLKGSEAHRRRTGRPFVTLSYAQSLDGSIADRPGHPLALSGSESLAMTHGLRGSHEAILVGIGTVLADNPRLSVRLAPGQDPQPIVVDSRLRFPPYANLLKSSRSPWIATGPGADAERQQALEAAGARVLRVPGSNGWVDLGNLLGNLGSMGINSLMVEGGAQIITSFLASRLVDQVVLTIAPLLVGGLRVVDQPGYSPRRRLPRLKNLSYQQLGDDLVLHGKPDWDN